MLTFAEAIKVRRSIRNYDQKPLEDNLLIKINLFLQNPAIGPFGNTPRFILIEKPEARKKEKVRLGTYGFISNAAYFIGGCIEKFEFSEVDYGYSLERIIIELTRLGLGTCWIGGTFKRKDYEILLKTSKSETIPCITPVGYKAKKKTLRERLGLTLTDGSKRNPFEMHFFENNLENPLSFNSEDKYHQALELVRKAPSAVNKQPWRVIKQNNKYHFYLLRDKNVGNTKNTDLQKVDLGIALAHFKLGIEEQFLNGKWHIKNPELCELEYIISWIAE
ncbi:MAG: nitroreductase family protein [Bacteroidales bacterium]|nr:nitroreductase family protein [Bacteroidales bacterium]MDY0140469.1 nitroreductase family protein [Bacteroidales bacterium]